MTDWNPSVTGNMGDDSQPGVYAIAASGNRVFLGGWFREIGGASHWNLGAVDRASGDVIDWNLDLSVQSYVTAMAANDTMVCVGGYFFTIRGQTRSHLAAVDSRDGTVKPWRPEPENEVRSLVLHDNTLYVGGKFGRIAGVLRPYLAAVDARTAALLPLDARADGLYRPGFPLPRGVMALALAGDTLYAGGDFVQIGGRVQSSLAAIDATTGDALLWNPPQLGPVYEGGGPQPCLALAVAGNTLYVGGDFETAGNELRPSAAAIRRDTGQLTNWSPGFDYEVRALAAAGDQMLVGGEFALVGGWQHRAGLAAIDLNTGALKPWNPNPDASVCTAVAVHDGQVFVSGNFANIGGVPQPRNQIAALDTLNGEVTAWNPGANGVATVFMTAGDTLYAGGDFSQVGGQARSGLAALSMTTGAVLPWNPNANSLVLDMGRTGNKIIIGGNFNHMGNQPRHGVAAVDASTGDLLPWIAETDNDIVEAVLVSGNTLYLGGGFGQVNGVPRNSLAAVDLRTTEVLPWSPSLTNFSTATPRVRALAMQDSFLFVGGSFASLGGQRRICLAAVDTATGMATDWDPRLNNVVWSLFSSRNTLFVGGRFDRAGGLPAADLAAFSPPVSPPPPPPPPRPAALALGTVQPNPVHADAQLTLALPRAGQASLAVYDLQGRRLERVLDRRAMAAGITQVTIDTRGWNEGVYFCRLELDGDAATKRFIVLR